LISIISTSQCSGGGMDVPPNSLESDVICAKSSGESEFSFFNCITENKNHLARSLLAALAPGEGIAKCFRSIPVYMRAPRKTAWKDFQRDSSRLSAINDGDHPFSLQHR
jgi:hypothetical protein